MSGATFVQPSGPTVGLQGYNLEKPVKNLVPDGETGWRAKLHRFARDQAARRSARKRSTATLKKDTTMTRETIKEMVDLLGKSVGEITSAGGDNVAELLAKNYTEFTDAVAALVDGELAKRAPAEEPLHKGLGTVSRISGLLSTVTRQTEAMKAGFDDTWQMNQGGPNPPVPNDPASADVCMYLDNTIRMLELGLRASVNEHVDLADDDDLAEGATLPPGLHLVMVPDGDDATTGAVVKTALPEDLAKYAIDPAVLQDETIGAGIELMMAGGVPEESLQKMFGTLEGEDVLGKVFPPKKPGDASAAASAQPDPNPNPPIDGATQDDDGSDTMDGAADGSVDDENPLQVAMRLATALIVVLHDLDTAISGTADDGTDPGADPNADTNAMAGMGKRALPATGETVTPPSAEVLELRKMVADIQAERAGEKAELGQITELLEKVLAQPLPAKGIANLSIGIPKEADGGTVIEGTTQEELKKMAPAERAVALTKAAQKKGLPVAFR